MNFFGKYFVSIAFCFLSSVAMAHSYVISGRVVCEEDKAPIAFALVYLANNESSAITNERGEFTLQNVAIGNIELNVQCMGYQKHRQFLLLLKDEKDLLIILKEENLTLDEVEVTAQKQREGFTTSYVIDRKALEHAQILNVTDITSLLPGGKTKGDQSLLVDSRFALHSGSSELGNASFGTAVEVDGMRLQNNAVMGETMGVDTRNLSAANVASVEVITGIPSVEYGDLSNGMVKIHTDKGKTPFVVTLATKPHTKQVAFSKGFSLGNNKLGLFNLGYEYTKSISNIASPYTAYVRNAFTMTYSHTLKNPVGALTYVIGLSGNKGGYNSKADPDTFSQTYTKQEDGALRAHLQMDWSLQKTWISNLSFSASAHYADKQQTCNVNKSSAFTQAQIHSMENGYYIATNYDSQPDASIILGPTGYWYELSYTDSKPISYAAKLKADWIHLFGSVTNKLMVGTEFTCSGNEGRGLYYADLRYAPTWRPYCYKDLPYMSNYAFYAEEKAHVPVMNRSTFSLSMGLRADMTSIRNSEYGTVNCISPRFNARYIAWKNQSQLVSDLSAYIGWGKSVKLPSFEILYPSPSYADKLAFAPGTMSNGTVFYAYYTMPTTPLYNAALKWQDSHQAELGVEAKIGGHRISVSAFRSYTYNPYVCTTVYTPYSYNRTDQRSLETCVISSENRRYNIHPQIGVVTVSDITGICNDETLSYTTIRTFKSRPFYTNGSPIERCGFDWVIDFAQIALLRTTFRLDGNYYHYKGINETMTAYLPSDAQTMANGEPYKYIGYYVGAASVANGSLSRKLDSNVTITTHIPKVRLVVSLKVESSLYHYKQNLSESSIGERSFVLEEAGNYFGKSADIYSGNQYVATYPLYYTTWDEPDVRIPFAEKFAWAKQNDVALYRELTKLVMKSNTDYYFNPTKISAYYSANLSVTKEIGNNASVSFYATNFFNRMGLVKSSNTGLQTSLYNSSYIPKFYYGLSLRLKL